MRTGRPRKFATAAECQAAVDRYFMDCELQDEPLTISGLALSIGGSRDLLCDYESGIYDAENDVFSDIIKDAKMRIASFVEKKLYQQGQAAAGPIFVLKNMHTRRWTDATQHQIEGGDKPVKQEVKLEVGDALAGLISKVTGLCNNTQE